MTICMLSRKLEARPEPDMTHHKAGFPQGKMQLFFSTEKK
jgi:hypothetical protein